MNKTFSIARKVALYIFVFTCVPKSLLSQNISSRDLSHSYDLTRPIRVDHQVVGDGYESFVLFSMPMSLESAKYYKFGYFLTDDLLRDPQVFVPLGSIDKYLQADQGEKSVYGVKTATNNLSYFVLTVSDTTQSNTYHFPISVPTKSSERSPDVLIYENESSSLFVGSYMPVNTTIKLNSLLKKQEVFTIHYFDHKFDAALPPMAKPPSKPSQPFGKKSTYQVSLFQVVALREEGLYLMYSDSTRQGLTLRIQDDTFPKPSSLEDLTEAMVYLATKEEYEGIINSGSQKAQFDEFWLYNIKSPDKAKTTIRNYYKRVKEANTLFTNYKEGWKTDKGMIYIIFGLPTKVFKENNKETWIYDKTFELPHISFKFIPVNTAFSNEHYVLERSPEHKSIWFRAIELWRKGRKDF